MDEKKSYWFEQPYMPRMKNIAVASYILEDGRLSFYVPGDILRDREYGIWRERLFWMEMIILSSNVMMK